MATLIATGAGAPEQPEADAVERIVPRRRRVSPQAGRALEMLGHAIEYLTDEHVHRGGDLSAHDPEIEAIQLLMARNRQVYFDCPEIPTVVERCRAFLRAHFISPLHR